MKKLFTVIGALSLLTLSGCSNTPSNSDSEYQGQTLKVFNWGEYIEPSVISDFEDEFGVTVVYETFLSNEAMYTKVQTGETYDVLVPSDYMIERMVQEDMLQELDLSKIPNIENLADGVKNLPYDPENTYSVPYFWGSVGIVYNKNNVDINDLENEGWAIFQDTDYAGRIYMYDSERDSFMIAFKSLGYSMNTSNESEIQEAYDWLIQINDTMSPAYVTDEVIDAMSSGQKDLAVVYSGDAVTILMENEDMAYYCPTEGTNLWSDAMVIPKNAENPDLAHEFINFILGYDASYANSEYAGYASSNAEVLEELSAGEFEGNDAYIPRSGYDKDEVFVYNKELTAKLSELWVKVKAH